MSSDTMEETVGKYGGDTSGFTKGKSVRGLWGRGLKDAIFGLGHGHVYSIKDGLFNHSELLIKDNQPTFEIEDSIRAKKAIRKQWGAVDGNCTVVEIIVSRKDVSVPLFDNIKRYLEHHFELRLLLGNTKKKVTLREVDKRNKTKTELTLSHKAPRGSLVLEEDLNIPGYDAKATLTVFRSDVPLTTTAEEGVYADGGFLVISKDTVLDLQLFKFQYNEYAAHFYGSVTCDYLYALLKKQPPEPILTATRDGINWDHAFTRALKIAIESKLDPLVELERKRAQEVHKGIVNKKLRERLNVALKELNSIAKEVLGNVGEVSGDGIGNKTPQVPVGGFGFIPDYAYVQTGKLASLTLRALLSDKVFPGAIVTIESDNSEVSIASSQVVIEQRTDYTNIGEAHIQIEGRQVGAEAIITARLDSLKAEALVKVISKKISSTPPNPPDPKQKGTLIRDFRFDPNAEPRQRVRFERATSEVVISTKAPSVEAYFDETGNGTDTPQGQVLLAELIAEAACREIARRGVESEKLLMMQGSTADSIQYHYNVIQNKYAHLIHECLVDPKHRRNMDLQVRKGRPKRSETLKNALIEA